MVKLRPYVVAVNHVPGCPRLESGQGGRKQGRRRCAPGCERVTNGWEVDLALRLPDGTPIRERVKAPVSGRSAALRWAQEREGQILAQKGRKPKQARQVPTVAEFKPRFVEGHVKANRLKPSSAEAYESIFRTHLEPEFGPLRLDAIGDERVQRFKGELVEDGMANKSINNVLTALSVMLKRAVDWKVIDAMPCRIRLLKWDKGEVAFYDFSEYRRLVEAAAAIDPRIELLVLLGGDAGLRRGEIIALEQSDCDTRRGILHVRRSEWKGHVTLPKGGRERQVNMTDRLRAVLTTFHWSGEARRPRTRPAGTHMTPTLLFQVHLVLGYVAWLLCFGAYTWPRLRAMDPADAQRAIATLHGFRFFGLVFPSAASEVFRSAASQVSVQPRMMQRPMIQAREDGDDLLLNRPRVRSK